MTVFLIVSIILLAFSLFCHLSYLCAPSINVYYLSAALLMFGGCAGCFSMAVWLSKFTKRSQDSYIYGLYLLVASWAGSIVTGVFMFLFVNQQDEKGSAVLGSILCLSQLSSLCCGCCGSSKEDEELAVYEEQLSPRLAASPNNNNNNNKKKKNSDNIVIDAQKKSYNNNNNSNNNNNNNNNNVSITDSNSSQQKLVTNNNSNNNNNNNNSNNNLVNSSSSWLVDQSNNYSNEGEREQKV